GSLFASSMAYVAARLLGESPDAPWLIRLRAWIHGQGTPLYGAGLAKVMLAVLDLYDYSGLQPMSPELWLLPYAAPCHPGRFWSPARQIYLPMAYLYGTRARRPADPLVRSLREELYGRSYASIPWPRYREAIAPCDALHSTTRMVRIGLRGLRALD